MSSQHCATPSGYTALSQSIPSVRCATLGFDVKRLRRRRESNLVCAASVWWGIALIVCVAISGCSLAPHQTRPEVETAFHASDEIVVENKTGRIAISDAKQIARLQKILDHRWWKPYIGTLPAGLHDSKVSIYGNGEELLSLAYYAGELWDVISYEEVSSASLSNEDQAWIDTLFEEAEARAWTTGDFNW